MKKKVLAILLAAAMVFSMAACGGKEDTNADAGTQENVAQEDGAQEDGAQADAGAQADSGDAATGESGAAYEIPASYPEKTVKIGVELYDPADGETIAMQEYFKALQDAGLNVEFIYSEALDSAEAELKFIDDCYNAGCQGIIGYYNVALGETVQRCVDYGMYYWGAALDYPEVIAQFESNDYVLDMVGYGNGDYEAGYAIAEYFAVEGVKDVVWASGGADFGVTMFVNRQQGFMDAATEAGMNVITVSGFPGDAFFADQAAALSEDIDAVGASFNGVDFWAQPIATAGKTETVKLGTIGSINDSYVQAFENGSVAFLASGNVQRFGIGVALIVNAVDGNAEALQVDGKIGSYVTSMWLIDSPDLAKQYQELSQNAGVYRYEDLMSVIVNVNPNANVDTLKALTEGGNDLESIEIMHQTNN